LIFFLDLDWTCEHQNNKYWTTLNPYPIHKVPIHDVQCGILHILNGRKIICPAFNAHTINFEIYKADIAKRPVSFTPGCRCTK
jgi:hypothetical protein